MGAHDIETRIKGIVVDGQHRVEGSKTLTAGDVHSRVKPAGEVAAPGWSLHGLHADPTVDGMIVGGSLKCDRRHVGMQEQIFMSIASVDGKCYDNARACVERKLSGTMEVNSRSLRFDQ